MMASNSTTAHTDFGVLIFPTAYSMSMDKLAAEVEARGFESLFVCEHTHIPANRATPWPGGAELPREYYHTLDPYVALTCAAAATRSRVMRMPSARCAARSCTPLRRCKKRMKPLVGFCWCIASTTRVPVPSAVNS